MIIEIGYSYQADKNSPAETSWTYFYVKGDNFDTNKPKAQRYFKKWVSELGWAKNVKVIHIEKIQNHNSLPTHIVVAEPEIPKNVTKHSRSNRKTVRQSKEPVAGKEPKVRRQRSKPSKSDESVKSSGTDSGPNRRQTKSNKTGSRTPRK